jgi:hypothetical protein
MFAFIGLSFALFLGLAYVFAQSSREEVMANWSKYRDDPFYMFMAPLFKPEDDPRTPVKFGADNFYDVLQINLGKLFAVLLAPLFTILKGMSDMLVESTNGLFNMKSFLSKMYTKMANMTDIFNRRFAATLFALRKTNIGLYNSFQRTYAVAMSSAFAGYSTFQAIHGAFKLMITTVIVILVILVALVILFFFVLAPSIPLILSVIAVIGATSFAAGVGGMSSAFCFVPGTRVAVKDGAPQPIERLRLGDALASGAHITGILDFDVVNEDLYNLYDVQVSGSHIVYAEDSPIHVRDHPDAIQQPLYTGKLVCLLTSDHKIPIVSNRGVQEFADWEEMESETDLNEWYNTVYSHLNGIGAKAPVPTALDVEAALSGRTRVWTPMGPTEIRNLRPGMTVFDQTGNLTRIQGVVRLSPSLVPRACVTDKHAHVSAGAWIFNGTKWAQPSPALAAPTAADAGWYHLFTESGTFRLADGTAVRDFSDIGSDQLETTYKPVLESLCAATRNLDPLNRRTCPPALYSF